jgi:hypothetical protein
MRKLVVYLNTFQRGIYDPIPPSYDAYFELIRIAALHELLHSAGVPHTAAATCATEDPGSSIMNALCAPNNADGHVAPNPTACDIERLRTSPLGGSGGGSGSPTLPPSPECEGAECGPQGCVDADGDGWCADFDCDDNASAVHPWVDEAAMCETFVALGDATADIDCNLATSEIDTCTSVTVTCLARIIHV